MTFLRPIPGRTFLPEDSDATLVTSASEKGVMNPDYRSDLEAYKHEREMSRLMMNRVGVCG